MGINKLRVVFKAAARKDDSLAGLDIDEIPVFVNGTQTLDFPGEGILVQLFTARVVQNGVVILIQNRKELAQNHSA